MEITVIVKIGAAVLGAILGLALVQHLMQDPTVIFLSLGFSLCVGVYLIADHREKSGG